MSETNDTLVLVLQIERLNLLGYFAARGKQTEAANATSMGAQRRPMGTDRAAFAAQGVAQMIAVVGAPRTVLR
jgi:hypothetical protein